MFSYSTSYTTCPGIIILCAVFPLPDSMCQTNIIYIPIMVELSMVDHVALYIWQVCDRGTTFEESCSILRSKPKEKA
jgi:hypothetical protein